MSIWQKHVKFVVGFHQAKHVIGGYRFPGRLVGGFHFFQKQGAVTVHGDIHDPHLDQGHAFEHRFGILESDGPDDHPFVGMRFHHFFAVEPHQGLPDRGPSDA